MGKKEGFFTFIAINGLLWCFISLGFFKINGFYTDIPGIGFALLFWFSHIFLFAWAMGLLCLPFRYVAKPVFKFACVFWASLFFVFLLIDLFVFSQYRFHIGLAMLELFFGPAGREIFVFPTSMWLITYGTVLFIIALEIGILILSKHISLSKKLIKIFVAIWIVCFISYNCLYAWGKFMMVPSIISQRKVLPLAFPLSANRRLEKLGFEAKKDPFSVPKKGMLNYPLTPMSCLNKDKTNVLILAVDSLRADMLNEEAMPLLSKWAKEPGMTVFTNHISNGNGTQPGIFSIFYSLPGSYWDDFTALNLPPVLVTKALEDGYEPAVFTSADVRSPTFYRNMFATIKNLRIGSEGNTTCERDVDAVSDFEEFLNKRDKNTPFFGFIFLDGPHTPDFPAEEEIFKPSKEWNYLFFRNSVDNTPYLNYYKNAVHFSDKLIDRVLTNLKNRNLLENTFIVITGDHGQEANDSHNNFWGHNSSYNDYQTKVPLLIYQAGKNMPKQIDYPTAHYDIGTTIVQNVYNCSNPAEDYSVGQNLFKDSKRDLIVLSGYNEKVVRIGDDIMVFDDFGAIQQYDNHSKPVKKPIDPNKVREGLQYFNRFYK